MAITSYSANAIAFAKAISSASASALRPAAYNSIPDLQAIVLALGAKP